MPDDDLQTPGEIRACELAVRLLGATPVRVWATSSPDAKFAELPDGRQVVVKWPGWRNDGESVLGEVWAYGECRRRGIRVPGVVAASLDPVCMIAECLPGTSIDDHGPGIGGTVEAWAAARAELRRLHEIRLPGFGPLRVDRGAARGEGPAWCPFVDEARTRGVPRLVDRGFLDHSVGERLVRRLDAAAPRLADLAEGRLLHGDLAGGHIFWAADGYRGMIDFGQAQVGDPRWDLARVLLWDGDDALDALLDGYGRDALAAEDHEAVLPLYLFAFACHHAAEHPNADYIRMLLDRSRYRALL